jgi:hypothetical protein
MRVLAFQHSFTYLHFSLSKGPCTQAIFGTQNCGAVQFFSLLCMCIWDECTAKYEAPFVYIFLKVDY